MPTTNYDASVLTRYKRSATLRAYNNNLQAAKNANGQIVLREQPTVQLQEVIAQRSEVSCGTCSSNVYTFNDQTVAGDVSG